MSKNANFVSHKKSKQIIDGKPKLPLASDIVEGEIAINFGKDVETMSIKNESGDVVTFSSDNYYTKKKLGSGFTGVNSANTVTSVIKENEEIISSALNDLDGRKLDASAYTPTDLSNYYNKTEIDDLVGSGFTSSSITEVIIENEKIVSAALNDLNERKLDASAYTALNNVVTAHTANTTIHVTQADKDKWNNASGGFKRETNPTDNTKVGLVNGLSQYYDTNIGKGAVIEGDGRDNNDKISASGDYSHAECAVTTASGDYSHAEGSNTTASGSSSHAEGSYAQASGNYSHAEGSGTTASGQSSHAEGSGTKANGNYSHAEGFYTVANNQSEHASGQYNISSSSSTTFGNSGNTLFSVGNGTSDFARHNAFEIRQNGLSYMNGNVQVSGTVSQVSDERLKDIIEDKELLLEEIVNAPLVSYTFKGVENDSPHIGTIAQYWLDILPEVVCEYDSVEKNLSLDYSSLNVAIGISLAKIIKKQSTEIDSLKEEIMLLKQNIGKIE